MSVEIMTTYTYPVGDGCCEPTSGMTAREVAAERLIHDGSTYELRHEPDGDWQLYGSSNMPSARTGAMVPLYDGNRLLYSLADTEADAWAELAPRVVNATWSRVPDAMTDEDYAAMQAEIVSNRL